MRRVYVVLAVVVVLAATIVAAPVLATPRDVPTQELPGRVCQNTDDKGQEFGRGSGPFTVGPEGPCVVKVQQ